jgi:hypothetical protein
VVWIGGAGGEAVKAGGTKLMRANNPARREETNRKNRTAGTPEKDYNSDVSSLT